MEKLLCVVFVSSLLLATLADDASYSPHPSLNRQQGRVLGRKVRELNLLGYHQYRHEGEHKKQHEVTAMDVKKAAETKGGWSDEDEDEDDAKEGMIYSADYSGVAMHSPPVHKHPKP